MWRDPVETRSSFTSRYFNQELRTYTKLRDKQGTLIPKFLGYFDVEFPDRDLAEDRVVKVMMLEYLNCHSFTKSFIRGLTKDEKEATCARILETVRIAMTRGVFFTSISKWNFVFLKADKSVRMIHFGNCYDPTEMDIDEQRQSEWLENALEDAEDLFE